MASREDTSTCTPMARSLPSDFSAASIDSRADIGDRDLAALRQQRADQADPDSVGAAGDERGAACKILHDFNPFWRAISAAWIGLRNSTLKVLLYSWFSGRLGTAAHIACARSSTPCRNSLWVMM